MAVYKVIQDIEAEDKLLGPLTLKSFIYALIAGTLAFICVRLAVGGGPTSVKGAIIILLLPPILLFSVLAFPFGHDQPTEVWLLSHIRFLLKPRKKVWDQMGKSELVTITVPKKIERHLTKELSQVEVKSRLSALASTLDSRGWAVKNINLDVASQPQYFSSGARDSDRLVGTSSVSQPAPVIDVHASDDIMDEANNSTARKFNEMMQVADVKRKQDIVDKINAARASGLAYQTGSVDYRFLDEQSAETPGAGGATFVGSNLTVAGQQANDNRLTTNDPGNELGDPKLRSKHPTFTPKPSLADERRQALNQSQTIEEQKKLTVQKADMLTKQDQTAQAIEVTAKDKADKIELAQSGNDLSVASIASLANRRSAIEQISPNEVVINLH